MVREVASEKTEKLVVYNYAFWPDSRASAVLLRSLLPRLAKEGPVEIVCGVKGPAVFRPGHSSFGEVRVRRAPSPFRGSTSTAARLLDYLWVTVASALHLLCFGGRQFSVLCSEPPLVETALGIVCRLTGKPYAVIVHDLYPEFVKNSGIRVPDWLFEMVRSANRFALRGARVVIAVSEDMRSLLASEGVSCEVIEHWCEAATERPRFAQPPVESPIVIQYAGHVGNACDLEALAKALDGLALPDRFRFRFHCYGMKLPRLRELATRFRQIEIGEWLPYEKLAPALAQSDVQLILTPSAQFGCVYASKLYMAMAAGKPILASLPRLSRMHQTIAELGVGLTANADEPQGLVDALDSLYRLRWEAPERFHAMGERGLRFTEHAWNGERAAQRYAAAFALARRPLESSVTYEGVYVS